MHSEAHHSVRLAAYAGCLCVPPASNGAPLSFYLQRQPGPQSPMNCGIVPAMPSIARLLAYNLSGIPTRPRTSFSREDFHGKARSACFQGVPPEIASTTSSRSTHARTTGRPHLVVIFLASLLHTRIGGGTHTRAYFSTGSFNKQENSRQLILFPGRRGYSAPKQAQQ